MDMVRPQAKLVERVKSQHIGKWIGLKNRRVVAISDTHEDLYRKLREKDLDGVYVFYCPTDEQKKYGFLF